MFGLEWALAKFSQFKLKPVFETYWKESWHFDLPLLLLPHYNGLCAKDMCHFYSLWPRKWL
eukprot:c40083_g1_i1 orf=2-181(-)